MPIFSLKPKLKVLFVASEAAPFVKAGGLGEVMFSLPKALREMGHDARIMIPKYATIDTAKFSLKLETRDAYSVSDDSDPYGLLTSNVLKHENERGETSAYFLENMEYYEKRANTYGYADDAVRWALLSKGTLEFLRQSFWKPDLIVASDWQTGLIPNYLHSIYKDDKFLAHIPVVFSIHNLSYQGMFDHRFVSQMDYDDGQSGIPDFDDPRLLKLNFMRRGIMYADIINTVSPTYAQEITTPEYGELLDELLSERRSRLSGILNGIDYFTYNPETDPNIEFNYGVKTLDERIKNKTALQRKFGLPENKDLPVFGIVSRLTEQKGVGLLMDAGWSLIDNFNFQLIVLGTGDSHFMSFFQELAAKFPIRVAYHPAYDEILPRLIYAGADIILIPSKFEPSGLTQMEAMRYGAVPIVRKTGGLADSVIDYDPKTKTGNGFVFKRFDYRDFYGTVVRALETYKYPEFWKELQKRAMKAEFSWGNSAKEYVKLFKKAAELH